jgi:guanylate kinase
MTSIDDDKVIVMIGKRGTGKSSLVKNLLYYHKDIPVATIISATE